MKGILACQKQKAYFLERTALKPNVRFEIIAVVKPSQLKDRSEAEAMPTPACKNQGLASRTKQGRDNMRLMSQSQ